MDATTATLPAGWESRAFPLQNDNTGGATGWCLEVHDLACSKLVAGREKDLGFLRILLTERMVELSVLNDRLGWLPLPVERIETLRRQVTELEGRSRA